MTKAEELKILAAAIKKLGPDSYLGPALEELLPFAESAMRSDLQPDLLGSLQLMRADVDRLEDQLKETAGKLRDLEATISARHSDLLGLNTTIGRTRDKARDMVQSLNSLLK